MTDEVASLVKRLRTMAGIGWNPIGDEAADRIEELENQRDYQAELATELFDKAIELNKEVNGLMELLRKDRQRIEELEAVVDAAKYIQSCIDRGCHSMETVPDLREALAALEDRE